MADHALFYNSVNGDRQYDADDFTEWLRPFFTNGVYNGHLQVTSTSGMGVQIAAGYANVGGKVRYFDEATALTLDRANASLGRIDNIVVRRDDTTRDITLAVVKGTNSSNPVAPDPVRSNGIYDLVIARVNVPAAAVSIDQASITDTRMDSNLCGWIASTVEEIDFSQITEQWQQFISNFEAENQEDFDTWYQDIKEQFYGDVPGVLQAEIDELEQNKADANHSHVAADITDLPPVPTITDTYSGTSSDGMSGKAVKSAIDALDGTITGSAGAGKTLTAFSQTDGKVSATFGNISITKSQVSDFPTIPTITDTYSGTSSNGMSGKAVKSAIDALDVTNISGFGTGKTLKTLSETDGKIAATFQNISITKSQVSDFPTSMTPASHTHGKITNAGDITSNVAIASGDRLVINDESASQLNNSSITFGTSTTTFLTNKGTWATPAGAYPMLYIDPATVSHGTTYVSSSTKYTASANQLAVGYIYGTGSAGGSLYINGTKVQGVSCTSSATDKSHFCIYLKSGDTLYSGAKIDVYIYGTR